MRLARRGFLKAAAAGAVGLAPAASGAAAAVAHRSTEEGVSVLVDTTLCIGCRSCEMACAETNGLPEPTNLGDDAIFDAPRSTGPEIFTVVNRARAEEDGQEARYAKTQCLHCLEPACASACPVKALEKTPQGPVVYHPDRCMGCRYCMIACPFDVPKYQYDRPIPYVRKCTMCATRLAEGNLPACVDACPVGALTFGKRRELLETARERIYGEPGKYVRHIYGEREAGGTSWLYIGDSTPGELGLDTGVSRESYAKLTGTALAAVPVIMTLWPPLLMGLWLASKRREEVAASGDTSEADHD